MPSIRGLETKIKNVLACSQTSIDSLLQSDPSGGSRVDQILDARAHLDELDKNRIRFNSDIETREQGERRTIEYALDNINHSDCSSCTSLRGAL
jgi:spore cortex formation protein SpoVR/YcgB (stage V sporulation)